VLLFAVDFPAVSLHDGQTITTNSNSLRFVVSHSRHEGSICVMTAHRSLKGATELSPAEPCWLPFMIADYFTRPVALQNQLHFCQHHN